MERDKIICLNLGVNSLKWNKLKYISKLSSIPPLIWTSEIALWLFWERAALFGKTHFAVRTLIFFCFTEKKYMFQAGCENHLCQFLIIVMPSIVSSEKIIHVLKKKRSVRL